MANITIENVDLGNVVLDSGVFRDDVITFAGADVLAEGTILARTTATGKLGIYAIGGAGGLGVPVAVLTYEVTATGAGDVPVRALVSGKVREELLIVDADGDGSNITPAILDQLRNVSIVPVSVTELNVLDNQ